MRAPLTLLTTVALVLALAPMRAAAASDVWMSGAVRDPNGAPVANVVVTAAAGGASFGGATTDAGGNWGFFLPPATYDFHATPDPGVPFQPATVAGVAAGPVQTVNFLLVPLGDVVLSGTVRDGHGGPLAGQHVDLQGTGYFTTSGADGSYAFYVPPGSYTIEMQNQNATETNAPEDYDLVRDHALSVTADTSLDLELPEVQAGVHVETADGSPVAGVLIVTDQSSALNLPFAGDTAQGWDWYHSTAYPVTDASGNANLWLFPNTAQHILTVVPPGSSGLAQTSYGVEVTRDGPIAPLMVAPPSTISGTLTDARGAPLAGQQVGVQLTGLYGAPVQTTVTAADGSYSLSVANGTYAVTVGGRSAGGAAAPESYSLSSSVGSPLTVTGNTVLPLSVPAVPVTVTVTGVGGAGVGGVALTTSEGNVSGLTLSGMPAGGSDGYDGAGFAVTDASGTAVLWLFPGASYQVTATPAAGSPYPLGRGVATLAPGAPSGAVTIALGGGFTLAGHVLDERGVGLAGQTVTLGGGGVSLTAVTDGAGAYSFVALPAGSYSLAVLGGGGSAPPSYRLDVAPAVALAADTVVDLTLPERLVTVAVSGAGGAPVGGVTVTTPSPAAFSGLAVGRGYTASGWVNVPSGAATTGSDGRVPVWLFTGVTTLSVVAPGLSYSPVTAAPVVTADEVLPVTLPWAHAPPVTSLAGAPVEAADGRSARVTLAVSVAPGFGVGSLTYRLDGGLPVAAAPGVAFSVAGAGRHLLTVSAVDTAGVVETPHDLAVVVAADTTPPVIGVAFSPSSYVDGAWSGAPVTVSFTASAASGIASAPGCGTVTVGAETAGTVLTCTAVSGVGLTSSRSVTVRVDMTPPVVAWSGVPGGGAYGVDSVVSISCSALDGLSGVASVSGCVGVSGYGWQVGPGSHTLVATAVDRAGNVGSGAVTFRVVVTAEGVCGLVRSWVAGRSGGLANSLCVKLAHSSWEAFDHEVEAQRGKALTGAQADELERLVGMLAAAGGSQGG